MKILLVSIGTRGDMEPFLAIGEILREKGHEVIGIDNLNDYYEVGLKKSRLYQLGIPRDSNLDEKRPFMLSRNCRDLKVSLTLKESLELGGCGRRSF